MHLPAYDSHRDARLADQARVRVLGEVLFAAVFTMSLALAIFA